MHPLPCRPPALVSVSQLSTAAPAPRKAGLVFCSLFAPCALPRPAGGTARGAFCFAERRKNDELKVRLPRLRDTPGL